MEKIKILSVVLASVILFACDNKNDQNPSIPDYQMSLAPIGEVLDVDSGEAWLPQGITEALPIFNVYTDDSLEVTSREQYKPGTYSLEDSGLMIEGEMTIRGRGNSTWDWDKKPYRLKLTESTELLGMPKSKHWVLLANFADKTLMRNDIAFMFSRSLGMAFTPRDRYVELQFNGAYQGVYQLVDQIRIDNDRVDIDEMDVSDVSEDAISGGYLMEIDFRLNLNFCESTFNQDLYAFCVGAVNTLRETEFCLDSSHGMAPFCLKDPENLLDPEWSAQREYIEGYFAATEAALFGEDFADPEMGYAAYLDVESAVNYYIINELFKNADGASASAFLYKKRGDKLFFGPIWDFDLALGNAVYNGLDTIDGWHIRNAPWFFRLFQDPGFESKVKVRWAELKSEGKLNQIFQYAQARALWLNTQQRKNFNLWPIFNWETWYTRIIVGSYELEVKEMIRWQHARALWMDSELGD